MKTLIIIVILSVVIFYSFKSLIKYFKGENKCCTGECFSKDKNNLGCNCHHNKIKK